MARNNVILMLFCMAASKILLLNLSSCTIKSEQKPYADTLAPYVEFIEKQTTNPVDYVFELFDKYDIVILGERDHRDTTQYILIEKIISDPRFIQKIGHVFTEIGVCNQTDNANRILKSNYSSENDFTCDLRNLYRNIDYEILWGNYNYWYFLNSIYRINKDLPYDEKITLHFTDVPFDWTTCRDMTTRKEFQRRMDSGCYRDLAMGINIIKGFDRILQDSNECRKKSLIILNSPHSYQNYICVTSKGMLYPLNSAASYVFDYYPGKVANIMINTKRNMDDKNYFAADGKWDAAFHFLKNPDIGFDMESSPFGDDLFDLYDRPVSNEIRYKDIFTGFIFYLPIEEWALTQGIPGIVTEDFYTELMRRERINSSVYGENPNKLKSNLKFYNNKQTFHIKDRELSQNLKKWKVK